MRVLLPSDYVARQELRYPVLYLLPNETHNYRAWTDNDHIEHAVGDTPLLVVMPDTSADRLHPLTAWIDSNFRTNGASTSTSSFSAEELPRIMNTLNSPR